MGQQTVSNDHTTAGVGTPLTERRDRPGDIGASREPLDRGRPTRETPERERDGSTREGVGRERTSEINRGAEPLKAGSTRSGDAPASEATPERGRVGQSSGVRASGDEVGDANRCQGPSFHFTPAEVESMLKDAAAAAAAVYGANQGPKTPMAIAIGAAVAGGAAVKTVVTTVQKAHTRMMSSATPDQIRCMNDKHQKAIERMFERSLYKRHF